ncbi:hypothetical protein AAVH_12957 [Aphelenchoides avenae]|nr:hypothetical protein AAVH_12957 [Aphelenchus avenae]
MGSCSSRCSDAQKSAFVKWSILRWILGDLRFKDSLPRPDYIHRLIDRFRETSSPESLRRVVFNPHQILCEYAIASCHLPGAYVECFPCPNCTHKDEDEHTSFVEVFHFANVHNPNVCATVTFTMPADPRELVQPTGCSIDVQLTEGCPNSPIVVVHSSRVVLHIDAYVFVEVLRFLERIELEKLQMVSRRWSNIIGLAEGSLQRRTFIVMPKFYGKSPGMLSVYFIDKLRTTPWRILRVLTTRGLSHALNTVRSHMRNAFVDVIPFFLDRVPDPGPPREMLVDMPPRETRRMAKVIAPFDAAQLSNQFLRPRKNHGRVQTLELGLHNRDATWAQFTSVLNQPRIRGFPEITISTTRVAIDTSEVRAILWSLQSLKLRVSVTGGIEPEDTLLTLPSQIIRNFLALREVTGCVAEFWLHLVSGKLPDVDEPTDRRKRFRYHIQSEDIVVRVSVYENSTTREHLSVVTCDRFRGAVLVRKGNSSLAELKEAFQRHYDLY